MQSRSRILVIDDDPMFRSLLVSLLRKDYLVSVAADGESGFAKAREHRPDLVIIDHQMPGWNGVKTLSAFRSEASLESVKAVMLTSDATKDTVLSAIKAGTDEYIIKTGFSKNDFLSKIGKLLQPMIAKAVQPAEKPADNPVAFSSEQKPLFDAPVQKPTEDAVEAFAELDDEFPAPAAPVDAPADDARNEEERLSEIMDDWD